MRTYPECVLCIMRLIKMNLDRMDRDLDGQIDLMKQTLDVISNSDLMLPPPVIASSVYKLFQEASGEEDLYREYKKRSTAISLELYPHLKAAVSGAENRLITAIKISALGNLLDVANPNTYDLEQEIAAIEDYQIVGEGLEGFLKELKRASRILVLADNAGETVFDRVLIEELEIPVIYAAKGSPAYNDATIDDALEAGLDSCAEIISNGSDVPGTYLPTCSREFLDVFHFSDLILAKGQGNYETLSDQPGNIYFLMKVKCGAVAQEIGLPGGSIVLKQGKVPSN